MTTLAIATIFDQALRIALPALAHPAYIYVAIACGIALGIPFSRSYERDSIGRITFSIILVAIVGGIGGPSVFLTIAQALSDDNPSRLLTDPGLPKLAIFIAVTALSFVLLATFHISLITIRPRVVRNTDSDMHAMVTIATILYQMSRRNPFYTRRDRQRIAAAIQRLEDAIRFGVSGNVPSLLDLPASVNEHLRGSAAYIRRLEVWATMPQASTVGEMRKELLRYYVPLFTGYLHYLPYEDPPPLPENSLRDWMRRAVLSIAGGSVPAILLLIANLFGLIPTEWAQSATAISVLSIIIGVGNVVRPGAKKSLEEAYQLALTLGGERGEKVK